MMNKHSFLGKILFSVFAISVISLGISEGVDAKKIKKTSSKRSGSAKSAAKKSGSKRSASSRSSKRSASSRSSKRSASSARRAASANSRRAAGNARRAAALAAGGAAAGAVGSSLITKEADPNACPVGKVISFNVAEDKYYSAKNKICNVPANAHEEAWSAKSGLKKLTWIDDADAYYFVCDEGFMEKNKTCVDAYTVCPIGVPVEKNENNEYINPNTDESCQAPATAAVKKVTGKEAEEWGIDVGYLFSCKENYYAEEVKGTEGYLASCVKCPDDKKSLANSIGEKSCKEAKFFCEAGTAFDETAQSCQSCKEGEFSPGAGEACKSCLGTGVATCDIKTGAVKTCKVPYELQDGACVNVCKAGTALIGDQCKACDAGTYALDAAIECLPCSESTTCDAKTGKATSCKAGSKLVDGTCVICDANTYSKGGTATTCTPCQDRYISDAGSSECKKSPELIADEKQRAEEEKRLKELREKYLHPKTTINNTWSSGSGSFNLGVGCYRAVALGAGGGATGSYSWIWLYYGQSGGNGGKAEVYFCVNSGTATVSYGVGSGGSYACYGNRAGNGGSTWFRVNGDLDGRFSGIYSGQTIYAYGGTGGYNYYYNGSSRASNGSISGIDSGYGLRYLPTQYYYSKTGFGTTNNTLTYGQVGGGAAGGVHANYYCGNNGANGQFTITTITPRIAMY